MTEIMGRLHQNALWLIKDPWYPHPFKQDLIYHPNLNVENNIVVDKILCYLPKLKHVKISMSLEHRNTTINIHPKLSHLDNTYGQLWTVYSFMKKNALTDIVYCGFHYGRCIIDSTDGAKKLSRYFNIYVKKELCGIFLGGKIKNIEHADEITRNYAVII